MTLKLPLYFWKQKHAAYTTERLDHGISNASLSSDRIADIEYVFIRLISVCELCNICKALSSFYDSNHSESECGYGADLL